MIKVGDTVSIEMNFFGEWDSIGIGLIVDYQKTGRHIDYVVLINGQIETYTELSTCRIKKLK